MLIGIILALLESLTLLKFIGKNHTTSTLPIDFVYKGLLIVGHFLDFKETGRLEFGFIIKMGPFLLNKMKKKIFWIQSPEEMYVLNAHLPNSKCF